MLSEGENTGLQGRISLTMSCRIVEEDLESALIMEDDMDWYVYHLKSPNHYPGAMLTILIGM